MWHMRGTRSATGTARARAVVALAAVLATVVLAVIEADAVIKGQTASSSYKNAVLENGLRILVPPFITAGEKIVVNTNDVAYVRRAE